MLNLFIEQFKKNQSLNDLLEAVEKSKLNYNTEGATYY